MSGGGPLSSETRRGGMLLRRICNEDTLSVKRKVLTSALLSPMGFSERLLSPGKFCAKSTPRPVCFPSQFRKWISEKYRSLNTI